MKREITPEIREKLLGILPHGESIPFKPLEGDLEEFSPIIYLRPWTSAEQDSYNNMTSGDDISYRKVICEFGYKGVVKIENLLDISTGEEIIIPMKDGKIDFSWYSELSLNLQRKIFSRVQKISGLVSEEKEGLE